MGADGGRRPEGLRAAVSVRRGDVWMVDFGVPIGSEAADRRPAVVASNDEANRTAATLKRGVVTVVPVTSNVRRIYPFQVKLAARTSGLKRESKAQPEQVRSVAIERLHTRLGHLPSPTMREIDEALRLHLNL